MVAPLPVRGEQPIFDEMPRWSGGWGVQLMQEYLTRDKRGEDNRANAFSSEEQIHLTHVQGVYTWDKSIRATLKIPVVVFAEKVLETNSAGERTRLQDQGLGDPTLALPLKSYFNLDGRSGSWTLTPQVRIPAGKQKEYTVFSRNWATGLSGSYATETSLFYLMTGTGAWYELSDSPLRGNTYFHFGVNYQVGEMNGHVIFKQYVFYSENESTRYALGPTVYLRVVDAFHVQAQTRHDVYSWNGGSTERQDHSFRLGIAVVY